MKRFIDDAKTLVPDSIDGLLQTSGGTLSRLDGFDRAIRVVLRTDYESSVKNAHRVALISGGGSGPTIA
jgi:dihydroxyacetone kinase